MKNAGFVGLICAVVVVFGILVATSVVPNSAPISGGLIAATAVAVAAVAARGK